MNFETKRRIPLAFSTTSILLLTLVFSNAVPAVHATPPRPLNFIDTSTGFNETSARSADGNIVGTNTFTGYTTGDLNVTYEGAAHWVIFKNGSAVFLGSSTITGTLFGSSVGTCNFSFTNKFSSSGILTRGRAVIGQCTGGLTGVHALVTITTPFVGATYSVDSGQVHIDPS